MRTRIPVVWGPGGQCFRLLDWACDYRVGGSLFLDFNLYCTFPIDNGLVGGTRVKDDCSNGVFPWLLITVSESFKAIFRQTLRPS